MRRWLCRAAIMGLLVGSGCTTGSDQHRVAVGNSAGGYTPRAVEFLRQYARTGRFRLGEPTSIKLTPDGGAVLFLRSPGDKREQDLYIFDTKTGQEDVLLTAEKILAGGQESLSAEELARRERMRQSARGIASYELSRDGSKILVPLSGRLFVIERTSGKGLELPTRAGETPAPQAGETSASQGDAMPTPQEAYPIDARFSPDGNSIACVRNGELFVIDIETGVQTQLTHSATDTVTNGLSEFVAQEEMGRFEGYWWSPDSRWIAYQQTDTGCEETLYVADAAHPDEKPAAYRYPRAGRENADVRLGIISVKGGDTQWIDWDRKAYPYLATVRWPENAPLTILVQNRRQTEEILYRFDPSNSTLTELLREKDDAWLNLDQQMPKWLPDGKSFLWTTENGDTDGLELRSGDDGTTQNFLTAPIKNLSHGAPGDEFQGLVDFNPASNSFWFIRTEGPTQSRLWRGRYADGAYQFDKPSDDAGIHAATFSKDHKVYVHEIARLSGPKEYDVRSVDGRVIGQLSSAAEAPKIEPRIELTTASDDPMFHALLVRPTHFDPKQKYPVLVDIYGGPGHQTVRAVGRTYGLQQWFAEQGYIVVSIDGRGTPNRGREWEQAIKNDVISLPLEDQVTALQALGAKYRELDLDRVGIMGWSFGGYFAAMAVMQRPDVFHAAVAGAPVADWRDYDTHYTERYMGLPDENPAGYEHCSVLTHAPSLSRPLLLIHGTADDNVYFTHSLKLSNVLFRAGRPHEFLPLTDFTHMVAEPEVSVRLYERIAEFLARQLKP